MYTVTRNTFADAMRDAHADGLLDSDFMKLVADHEQPLNEMVCPEEDARQALRSLRLSYLLRSGDVLYERPQYMWLRSALRIHGSDLEQVQTTYSLMSTFKMIPSTTLLSNSGLIGRSTCSDYYLRVDGMEREASLTVRLSPLEGESMVDGVLQAGLRPALDILNSTLKNAGRRPGCRGGDLAVYLEPWHAEIEAFLNIIKTGGVMEGYGHITQYGLILNDLLIQAEGHWTLFCPSQAPLLTSSHGALFESEYIRLEMAGVGTRTVSARRLWRLIMDLQKATGKPSIVFKGSFDSITPLLGLMNPLTPPEMSEDIAPVASRSEHPVCGNTVALILPSFLTGDRDIDYQELEWVARHAALVLHILYDRAAHPEPKAVVLDIAPSALAVGVKTLGLADALALMSLAYDSVEAKQVNWLVSETVQFGVLDQCVALTQRMGLVSIPLAIPHVSASPSKISPNRIVSGRYNWDALDARLGSYPSLEALIRQDTSGDISPLVGYAAGSDPFMSLVSAVETASKVFVSIPSHFLRSMEIKGLWTAALRDKIIARRGSIQGVDSVPEDLQRLYKTAWDVDQHQLMDMAADRASFVYRGSATNMYMVDPSLASLTSLAFRSWTIGAKVGIQRIFKQGPPRPFPVLLPSDTQTTYVSPDCVGSGTALDPICVPW
ncbi:hypothetical protein D9611_011331 [Ephemerocybe angulata]|uniref:Ribonucleoside-diphosphate reductase n=1 Tax=Ephemerocybe angulata TaxID=980116 RepID=A0A8H5BBG3_9AGAR|nr:hypothetical protein D9611_011331 [Tulosesus angulatus]